MSLMIFNIEFKSNIGKMFAWLIVILVLMGLMMAFFPLYHEENILSLVEGFREGIGPRMANAIGYGEKVDIQKLDQYISLVFQYLSFLFAIFAMQIGAASLVKEQSMGTIGYLYGQPIKRSSIVADKFFANLFLYFILSIIAVIVNAGFAVLFSKEAVQAQYLIISELRVLGGLLGLGLFFIALGLFYSSLSNRVGHTEGGSVFIVILFYVVAFIGKYMGGQVEMITNYLPVNVFNPLMMLDRVNLIGIIINIGLALLLYIISMVIYNSKELRY